MDREESAALAGRARAGSAVARDELYRRSTGKLLALIRLRLGAGLRARLESRDILQSTLLRSVERFDQFRAAREGSFMAWLARIAENEIRDQADLQHRQRRDPRREVALAAAAELAAPVRSALSQAILGEEAERLERALEGLEPAHREVVVLRKLEELSFREVGERMGRSEDACRMLYARAMTTLALALERDR